jgi:mono/diheme cytochrome c family protein
MKKYRWQLGIVGAVAAASALWVIVSPGRGAAFEGLLRLVRHHESEGKVGHGAHEVPAPYADMKASPPIWTDPRVFEHGRAIYARQCAICHGERGDGKTQAAAGMRIRPPELTDKNMVAEMSDSYWFWRVSEGGVTVEPFVSKGSVMPAYKSQLSVDERWAVIAYAHRLSGHHGLHVAAEHPELRKPERAESERPPGQSQPGAAHAGMDKPSSSGSGPAMDHSGMAQPSTMGASPQVTVLPPVKVSPWVTRDRRWQPRGPWKYAIMRELPQLYREFNGIDFGHAHLAETLLKTQDQQRVEQARLEVLEFIFSSPSVPPDEEQVAPTLNRMAWEVEKTFDWTHAFHRSLYDLFASDKVQDKEAAYRTLLAGYLEKPEAITPHRLDHHGALWSFPESKSFRDKFRKFNTQIWAYHWLQAAVYDVQLLGGAAKQQELMPKVIAHYHGYLRRPPLEWQYMPMLPEASPNFAKRFPELAAIFDNLHMLHDNIDDVLSRPDLYPTLESKREAVLKILAAYLNRSHGSPDRYSDFEAKPGMAMGPSGRMTMMMEMGSRPPSVHEVLVGTAPPSDQPQPEPKAPNPTEKH